ncbi:uncharacterized protein LOC126212619 [Schistocerca nitens]|uniref:uncharacterized protein LOC126212619 n=1 Tax=Schistocerca nitens TaxID=7011 RepID=UPI002117D753|nr:uncharacterized protein LOC126212619 [Schistocerca nitens]
MDKFIIGKKRANVASVSDCEARPSVSGAVFLTKWKKTFMETGFSNWKKRVEKLNAHEALGYHREAVLKFKSLKSNVNVFSQISKEKLTQMKENRACLLKIISSLRYLAVQRVAIPGRTDETSNFDNLLRLRCEDNQLLLIWLQRETYKWTSHDVQNEILGILSHKLPRKLLEDIKSAEYLAIIADETTDMANKEQFSICIRFVDVSLEIEEYFLGLYSIQSNTAKALFDIIINILRRFDLPTSNCRGQCFDAQCFDGSANMAGLYKGVQANFMEMEKRSMFVHYLAHCLNLTLQDTVKAVPECRNALNVMKDLIHFVIDSPKRLDLFAHLEVDASANLKPLCPTSEVTSKCQDIDVDSSTLPRIRKVPKKYDDSINLSVETFTEVCDKYRRLYYETMDTSISFLESRFKTQPFMSVNQSEQFLLDIDKEHLLLHRSMFHEIIQSSDSANTSSLDDIVKYLQQENHLFDLQSELVKFMCVVLTIPVTSCTVERSFSCLRRVKTYLRSITRQDRLNIIALLNAHTDESMKLDLDAICDEFICKNDLRRSTFAIKN